MYCFLCWVSNHHIFSTFKSHPIYLTVFWGSGVREQHDFFLLRFSEVWITVSARLSSHQELRALAQAHLGGHRISFLQLEDWGPCFLAAVNWANSQFLDVAVFLAIWPFHLQSQQWRISLLMNPSHILNLLDFFCFWPLDPDLKSYMIRLRPPNLSIWF